MAGIVIRGVSKAYGDSVKALESLDLEVQPGELVVVVGPSGSGKTTLLRLVAGLDRPTAGTVCLGDRDLAGIPPQRRDVALVFQSLALYGHLTVEQNLAFALNAQTWGGWWSSLVRRGSADADVRSRVAQTASLLRIEHLLDRRPAELSGGEQQRVALGRAVVRQPKALLLDEPLSSLDLPTRRELRRELKELQRELGVPTIYVTHDQAEALAIGDRIAVLDRGRLAQVGTPIEIYERPRTRFVAEFFGPQGMNLIEGQIRTTGDHAELVADGLHIPLPRDGNLPQVTGQNILLGIRPEDIELTPTRNISEEIAAETTSLENLGESTYLHLRLTKSNTRITVRLPDNSKPPPTANNTAHLHLRPNRLHWFDATSGHRLPDSRLPTPETRPSP